MAALADDALYSRQEAALNVCSTNYEHVEVASHCTVRPVRLATSHEICNTLRPSTSTAISTLETTRIYVINSAFNKTCSKYRRCLSLV